jgi:hypothetical protein
MQSAFRLLRRVAISATALGAMAVPLVAIVGPDVASATSTANTALINGDSVTGNDGFTNSAEEPISLEQHAAEAAGYTVTVKTGPEWEAMTAEEFAKYQVLIVGDPDCSSLPASVVKSAGTWASAVMATAGGNTAAGNRTIVGTDPEFHYPSHNGAEHLVQDGITFAGGLPGATGAYFDTTCGDETEGKEFIEVLDQLTTAGPGHWTVNTEPPCAGSVAQIAENEAFNSGPTKLEDSDIQGWSCSVHVAFPAFPADWNALAVATDTTTKPTCGTDPSTKETACGQAYVLVSGTGIVATSPNISLEPLSGESVAGGTHAVTATVVQEEEPLLTSGAAGVLKPVAETVVSWALTGQNSGVAGTCTFPGGAADPECKTDANGQVVFTYPDSKGAGKDTINASVTLRESVQHATAAWLWTPAPVTVVTTPTPPATPVAGVLAAKVVVPAKGTARTASVRSCIASSGYLASVHGSSIASVTFTLDGHKIKTLKKTTSAGTYALHVNVRSGKAHHLSMHVVFTASSKTPATTLRKTLARCAAARKVLPTFTG